MLDILILLSNYIPLSNNSFLLVAEGYEDFSQYRPNTYPWWDEDTQEFILNSRVFDWELEPFFRMLQSHSYINIHDYSKFAMRIGNFDYYLNYWNDLNNSAIVPTVNNSKLGLVPNMQCYMTIAEIAAFLPSPVTMGYSVNEHLDIARTIQFFETTRYSEAFYNNVNYNTADNPILNITVSIRDIALYAENGGLLAKFDRANGRLIYYGSKVSSYGLKTPINYFKSSWNQFVTMILPNKNKFLRPKHRFSSDWFTFKTTEPFFNTKMASILKAKEMFNSGLNYKDKSLWDNYFFHFYRIQNPFFLKHGFVNFLFKKNVIIDFKKENIPYKSYKMNKKDISFLKDFITECSTFIKEINININNKQMNPTEGIFTNNDLFPRKKKPLPPASIYLDQIVNLLDPKFEKNERLTWLNKNWCNQVEGCIERSIEPQKPPNPPSRQTIWYNTTTNMNYINNKLPFYTFFISLDSYIQQIANFMVDYNLQREFLTDTSKWVVHGRPYNKRNAFQSIRPYSFVNEKNRILLFNQKLKNRNWIKHVNKIKSFFEEFLYIDSIKPNSNLLKHSNLLKSIKKIDKGRGFEDQGYFQEIGSKLDNVNTYLNFFFRYYMSRKKIWKEYSHFSDVKDLYSNFFLNVLNHGKYLDLYSHREWEVLRYTIDNFEFKNKIANSTSLNKINNVYSIFENSEYFCEMLEHNLRYFQEHLNSLYNYDINRKNFDYDIENSINYGVVKNLLPYNYFTWPIKNKYKFIDTDWLDETIDEAIELSVFKNYCNSLFDSKKLLIEPFFYEEEFDSYKKLVETKVKSKRERHNTRVYRRKINLRGEFTDFYIPKYLNSQSKVIESISEKRLIHTLFNLNHMFLNFNIYHVNNLAKIKTTKLLSWVNENKFLKRIEIMRGKRYFRGIGAFPRYGFKYKGGLRVFKIPFNHYYPELSYYKGEYINRFLSKYKKTWKRVLMDIRNARWRFVSKKSGHSLFMIWKHNQFIKMKSKLWKPKKEKTYSSRKLQKFWKKERMQRIMAKLQGLPYTPPARRQRTMFGNRSYIPVPKPEKKVWETRSWWKSWFSKHIKFTYFTKMKGFFSWLKKPLIRVATYRNRKYHKALLPYTNTRPSFYRKNKYSAQNTLNLKLAKLNSTLSFDIQKMLKAGSFLNKKEQMYRRNKLNNSLQNTLKSLFIIKNNLERYGYIFKENYKFIKTETINEQTEGNNVKSNVVFLKNHIYNPFFETVGGTVYNNPNRRKYNNFKYGHWINIFKKPTLKQKIKHKGRYGKINWLQPRGKRKAYINITNQFYPQFSYMWNHKTIVPALTLWDRKNLWNRKGIRYYRYSTPFITYINSLINRGHRHLDYKFSRKRYQSFYLKEADMMFYWRRPNKASRNWYSIKKKDGKDVYTKHVTPNNNWLEQYPFQDILGASVKNKRNFFDRPTSDFYTITNSNDINNILTSKKLNNQDFISKNTKNQLYHIKEDFLWRDLLKMYDNHFYNNFILDFFFTREKFIDRLLFEKLRYKYFLKISEEINFLENIKKDDYNILNFVPINFDNKNLKSKIINFIKPIREVYKPMIISTSNLQTKFVDDVILSIPINFIKPIREVYKPMITSTSNLQTKFVDDVILSIPIHNLIKNNKEDTEFFLINNGIVLSWSDLRNFFLNDPVIHFSKYEYKPFWNFYTEFEEQLGPIPLKIHTFFNLRKKKEDLNKKYKDRAWDSMLLNEKINDWKNCEFEGILKESMDNCYIRLLFSVNHIHQQIVFFNEYYMNYIKALSLMTRKSIENKVFYNHLVNGLLTPITSDLNFKKAVPIGRQQAFNELLSRFLKHCIDLEKEVWYIKDYKENEIATKKIITFSDLLVAKEEVEALINKGIIGLTEDFSVDNKTFWSPIFFHLHKANLALMNLRTMYYIQDLRHMFFPRIPCADFFSIENPAYVNAYTKFIKYSIGLKMDPFYLFNTKDYITFGSTYNVLIKNHRHTSNEKMYLINKPYRDLSLSVQDKHAIELIYRLWDLSVIFFNQNQDLIQELSRINNFQNYNGYENVASMLFPMMYDGISEKNFVDKKIECIQNMWLFNMNIKSFTTCEKKIYEDLITKMSPCFMMKRKSSYNFEEDPQEHLLIDDNKLEIDILTEYESYFDEQLRPFFSQEINPGIDQEVFLNYYVWLLGWLKIENKIENKDELELKEKKRIYTYK